MNTYQEALTYALRRLTAQAMHSLQLVQALEKKEASQEIIERVIAHCKQYGYLNDEEWLTSFVRKEVAKSNGPQNIIQKLQGKGLTYAQASSAVSCQDSDTHEGITTLLEKKYANRDLTDYKERGKTIAALQRKGYSFSDIMQVLDNRL